MFSNKKISIFLITLFLCENIYAQEIIVPKKRPKINELIKKEVIIPKKIPKIENQQETSVQEGNKIEKVTEITKEELLLPRKKPKLSSSVKTKERQKSFITPKNKPIKKVETVKGTEITKERKIVKKVTDPNLIYPKRKPIFYEKPARKTILKSKYFSKQDLKLARKVFSQIDKRKWTSALNLSKNFKDKSIYKLVKWLYLLEPSNEANFYDYINFVNLNPSYPRLSRLMYLAEHKINTNTVTEKRIIKLFNSKEPLSGYGKLMLGQSYLVNGSSEKGKLLIKNGWITAKLSKKDLKYFKKKLRKYLNTEDHIKRAEWLAWENKYWDLQRMIKYLPKDYQALYTARQLLMSKSYGVDNAIKKVPSKFKNNSGLSYDRLKWRRKRGRVESSLEILLEIKNDPKFLVRPEKWWIEREIISRSLIYKKKYELAYKIASNHAMSEGPEFAEAEWMSGWIALSFLKDPILATQHFHNFFENVGYPISLSRGAYWLGKSYEELKNKETSTKWFKEAAKYLTTYYGQLAFIKVYPNKDFSLDDEIKISDADKKEFKSKELTKLVTLLYQIKKTKYSKDILKHLALLNIDKGSEVLAGNLATKIGRYDYAIQIAKKASYEKRFHYNINFPIIDVPSHVNNKKMPSQELILAIIRQESEFDLKANSSVGARGMMQLMPYTAKIVAKQARLPYNKKRLSTDPEYNIKLGSYYIAGLLEQFEGSFPFSIASYNAGPKRVSYWNKINGNPQKGKIDYIDWIELIKFRETRNYVQRVLENVNVYKYMVKGQPIKIHNFFSDTPHY